MQLLAAAERAIAAIGPDVTMDQIAAEADVTKPILHRTVGDKADSRRRLVSADRVTVDVAADALRIGSLQPARLIG